MTIENKLTRLFAAIVKAAGRDPILRGEIEELLGVPAEVPAATRNDLGHRSIQTSSGPVRPKNRRKSAAFDPFAVFEESPMELQERLGQLDIEQLRDMVAEYAMDPSKLVIKWKASQRIVEHIVETVKSRLTKGDAFRA